MSRENDSKKIAELLGENGIENLISPLASGYVIFDYFEGKAKTIYISSAIKENLGFAKDIPVKSSVAGVDYYVHPDDMAIIRKDMARPRDIGEIYTIDLRLLSGDGSYHWYNFRVVLAKLENGHEIWNGIYIDIDDQRETERRLSHLYQSINGAFALFEYRRETGFKVLFTSEDVTKVGGIQASETEQSDKEIFGRVHPEERNAMREEFIRAIRTGGKITHVCRLRRPHGGYVWVKPNLTVTDSDKGKKLIYGTFTDIDELINAHIEVDAERERLRSVIEQSNIAIFDWSHKTGDYYMSDGFKAYAIAGAAENFIKYNQEDPSIVHHDDLPMLEEFFAKSLKGEPFGTTTVRMKMADGSYRWTTVNGYYTTDDNGAPLRSIGTLIDVDNERRMEQEMQMNVRRLKTVIDDTNIQYWEYDIINDVAYIGDILQKVYSLPEVMNNYPESFIKTGIIPEEYMADFRKIHIVLKNGALFSELKLPMNSPGGTVRWKHVRYRTIFNSESKPSCAIGTAIDITDQVVAETKLKQFKRAQKLKQQESAVK